MLIVDSGGGGREFKGRGAFLKMYLIGDALHRKSAWVSVLDDSRLQ